MATPGHAKAQTLSHTKRWLVIFILAHVVLWTLGPVLFRHSLTHDTLEGIAWGSQWQWGYNKHPFLAAWLSYGVSALTHRVGWPHYLLAQLGVAVTFWAVWRLALQFLRPNQALLATLSLEGVLFYNLASGSFTPDTLQSPLWALLALYFYHALKTQSIRAWLPVGVLAALSVVGKYQAALLFLPMFAIILINPETRRSFKTPGFYLAILVGLLCVAPHLIWLYEQDFITARYALETPAQYSTTPHAWPHFFYPFNFIINTIGNTVFLPLLLWPIYRSHKMPSSLTPFQWQFLFILGLGPWIISLLLCILSGNYFPARWMTPYFFLLGVLGVSLINPTLNTHSVKQFLMRVAIFMLLLWSAQFGRLEYLNRHENPADSVYPNIQLAQKVTALWHERYHTRLSYIAGSRYLVSALMAYSPDKPTPYFDFNRKESPWINTRRVRQEGALVVLDKNSQYAWDKESNNPLQVEAALRKHFPALPPPMRLEIPRLSKAGKPIVIWVNFIPPQTL